MTKTRERIHLPGMRAIRRAADITFEELGVLTHEPPSSLHAVENGRGCRIDRAKKIARALRCKVEELERK